MKNFLVPQSLCFLFFISSMTWHACSLPKDTLIDKQAIGLCSDEKLVEFEFIKNKAEGLHVHNPTNENIGYPKAFYDGWSNYYWIPVNGKKVSACGRLARFSIYDGQSGLWPDGNDSHEDEYDWNLTIVPHADFGFIISSVYDISGTTDDWHFETLDGRKYSAFQAEITPDESLYDNPWFPNIGHENSSYEVITPTIGVYGPWVMDNHHNNRPEIHPCEVIWWKVKSENKDEYFIFGIQDDSNRFDNSSDFEFDSDFGLQWKPWAVPPISSQYRIPFEYDGSYSDHMIINIEELRAHNVVTSTMPGSGDSDDGVQHALKFNSKIDPITNATAIKPSNVLVEVNESNDTGKNLGVQFVDICKKPNGNIIGYVQLFTAYGKDISGQEGYHLIKVTVDYPKNKIPGVIIR